MTVVSTAPQAEPAGSGGERPDESLAPPPRWIGLAVPVGVAALVALLAQLPVLQNRLFYLWDDSAAQFVPQWHLLGERIAAGEWSHFLDPGAWMGGDLPAEALFGLWNPVDVANYLLVSRFSDLAVAADVVKTEFLVLLALGGYVLCREYKAARGMAAAVAVALPFAGFTLYYEASSWAAGLIAFTWLPHLWWSARRVARGVGNPLWPFLFGGLAVTAGNPYGLLGTVAVLLALIVESAVRRERAGIWRLVVVGALVAAVVPLVYLPLVVNSPVSWRDAGGVLNDGILSPGLGDLVNASLPSYRPLISTFGSRGMSVPGTYLAWFLLPLLPWLRWEVLRRRWRELAGVLVVGAGYLALAIGPSNMWMLRFPLRHVEVLFLAAGVLFAVLASEGLATDRLRHRALATGCVLLVAGYLGFAGDPWGWRRHLVAMLCLAVGVVAAVAVTRCGRPRALPAVLVLGTALALLLQSTWFPRNRDVAEYGYPTSVAELRAAFAGRYQGTTFQVADVNHAFLSRGELRERMWRTFLFGNVGRLAGVETVASYNGMGFRAFRDAVCSNHLGSTCPQAWSKVTPPTPVGGLSLLDLMRVNTAVISRAQVDAPSVPKGWHVAQRDDLATVLNRDVPPPWPAGRLSFAAPALSVGSDEALPDGAEVVRFNRRDQGAPAQLVFARLAWPGYTASIAGRAVPVRQGPAGLLAVDVPPEVRGGELRLEWEPPGSTASATIALLGVLGALGFGAVHCWRRRRMVRSDGGFGDAL